MIKKIKQIVLASTVLSLIVPHGLVLAQNNNGQYIIENTVAWPTIDETTDQEVTDENSASEIETESDSKNEVEAAAIVDRMTEYFSEFEQNVQASSLYFQIGSQQVTTNESSTTQLSAQGLIKLFILAVYYQQVEQKTIDEKEMVMVTEDDVMSEDVLAKLPLNKEYDLASLVQLMIQSSDNSATNLVINALGGVEKVNEQIHQLGFIQTELNHLMLATDVEKDNLTSAADVANLLNALYQDVLLAQPYNEKILAILSQHGPLQLAQSFDANVKIYGKLGEGQDATLQHDAILFEIAENTPIILVVMSKSDNDVSLSTFGSELMQILGDER